jgi:hypothetical protein
MITGKSVTRNSVAPSGTSVTRSSGSFDSTGLAGGSNATTPFHASPHDGSFRAVTVSFTGVVSIVNGFTSRSAASPLSTMLKPVSGWFDASASA